MQLFTVLAMASAVAHAATPTDRLTFGDPVSEAAHQLRATQSDIVTGALGRPARRLLPLAAGDWRSGTLEFTLQVDPGQQNYATVQLWGGDANPNKITLYCDGKQIGYRHLGDIEILDLGTAAPMYAGRYTYRTLPLPLTMTRDKSQLACRLRATGPYAVYNQDFSKYQRPMEQPSRPLYALYTHTAPWLDTGNDLAAPPAAAAVRPAPGAEVMDQVQQRVNREIDRLLAAPRALTLHECLFLARAYHVRWTGAYRNAAVVDKVVHAGDRFHARFLADPAFIYRDTTHTNPDWEALGPFGRALHLLQQQIAPVLDQPLNATAVKRRDGYAAMLAWGQDYIRQHRRVYTNQSMIVDLFGIYYSNQGLVAVGSGLALPEKVARNYLYESMGLRDWSGNTGADGQPDYRTGSADNGEIRLPQHYRIFTAAGLSKELGYVGSYGEIQDWATGIYLATVPVGGTQGDPQLLAQLIKISRARLPFRYPATDADGYRTMQLEAPIGWRDPVFPGVTSYVQKTGWDNTPFYTAVASRDPVLLAAGRQMLQDNQFFNIIGERLKLPGQRTTFALLDAYDEWQTVARARTTEAAALPMAAGQPDFVFADTENGVIALKRGEETVYASLYWRAMCGVNRLFRVHQRTPVADRVATFYGRVDFVPSGRSCTRGASPHTAGGPIPDVRYPDDVPAALEGEVLPAAQGPADADFTRASFDPYAGRGTYYEGAWGPYLFAMNAGGKAPVTLLLPAAGGPMTDLVTKQAIAPGTASIAVAPGQSVVIYTGR